MLVSILGPISVERDGERVALGPRLQRLLAALVARRGSVASADALADIVWEGSPPEASETTIRSYVTRLRNALISEEPVIVFRQSGYELLTDEIEIDADLFESDVDDALVAFQTADHRTADVLFERALSRWAGQPYGDLGDEDWARPERVRLEERRMEALESRIEIMLADSRGERAIGRSRELVEEFPLRERPRELLMRAMYISGRQAEAVRVFRDYRTLLADETGLDPSGELAELERQILAGELPRSAPAGRVRSYELAEVLGRGAFSVVHRAVQPGVGRDVAVKIIRAELADQPDFVRRFEHEAQLAAAVEHPHVVPLYDFWREPGAAFLVMRWMRGGSVADSIRSRGPMSREQLVELLSEVGGALHAAHRAGVVHRDVRPANLLLDEDGGTYLADFGIAVASTIGMIDRPVHYAAPELLRGQPVEVTADIHSLGVTTYELLTGRLPLADTTDRVELVGRQLTEPMPPVRAIRTDLPSAIDDVLAKATSKVATDRHASVPEFVDDVANALAASDTTRRVTATGRFDVANPYIGLHAFTEADADRFHGRDQLIGELADAVEQHPLVVVVGPSGSGKSSVVRAGLVPALRRGAAPGSDRWFITTMFPGTDPIAALETALLRVAVNPPASLREQLDEDGGLLRAVRRVLPDDDGTVLIVIDQFEELFTIVDTDEVRDRFLAELAHAIRTPGSPLRLVATLRADHYDAPLGDPALAQLVTDGTVTVRPMRTDELERAIVEPARGVGVEVAQALVADLVAGVTQRAATLPLLQFSLTELFDRRVAGAMLLETHRSLGGLTGALAARADRIIDRTDERDRELARRIFQRLVSFGDNTAADTRRRAPLGEFGDHERTAWLVDEFVSARLLVVDRDDETREPTLEVAHEALLRDWPLLTEWIDEDRTDLRVHRLITIAAGEWADSDRDDGALARGGRLELVTDLADRRPDLLNEIEREWVARSAEVAAKSAERDRRQRRRLRVAAAAIVALAVAGAAVALVLRNRAEDSRQVAEARELILEAEKSLDDDPVRATLLGIAAIEQYQSTGEPVPTAAVQVLRTGIAENREVARFPGGRWVAVSGDGTKLVSDSEGGEIAVWRWPGLDRIDTVEMPTDMTPIDGWFKGNNLYLLALDADLEPRLFSGGLNGTLPEAVGPGLPLGNWADANEAADTIVALDDVGTARVWSLGSSPVLEREIGNVTAFHLEDRRLVVAAAEDDRSVISDIDLDTGARRSIDVEFEPDGIAVSPDGSMVALSLTAGNLAIYDLASGEVIWSDDGFDLPRPPTWSAESDRVVAGTVGATVLVSVERRSAELINVHDSGTDVNAVIAGTSLVAATSQTGQEVVIYRLDRPDEGVGEAVELPFPGALTSTMTTQGDVLSASRVRYAIVDPNNGDVEDDQLTANDTAFGEFGWTIPYHLGDRGYVATFDGRSHLRTTDDPRTVWTAPEEWLIRGIDRDAARVAISRWTPQGARTRVVSLNEQPDGTMESVGEVELQGILDATTGVAFSPDGELMVAASTTQHVLYDADGAQLHVLDIADWPVIWWTFTPDGSKVFGGTLLGQMVVLDVQSLLDSETTRDAIVLDVPAHDTRALAHDLSSDGSMVATVATDSPARVWNFETGELIAEFGSDDFATAITFHLTEPWVYVAEGGVLTTHTLDVDELLEIARESVTRSLTEAECERYLRRSCNS